MYRVRCFDENHVVTFDRWGLTRHEAVQLYWSRSDHRVQLLYNRREVCGERVS